MSYAKEKIVELEMALAEEKAKRYKLMEYVILIEEAYIDALDGASAWYDIQEHTGLNKQRCIELEEIYNNLVGRNL